jgi:hypothetical protein
MAASTPHGALLRRQEPTRETQVHVRVVLGAALGLREREGSCQACEAERRERRETVVARSCMLSVL